MQYLVLFYYNRDGQSQMTVRRMRSACWIMNATNTHSEYVILSAFPLQQWLYERASMLRHTYIACIFCCSERTEYLSVVAVIVYL
jgi:hypothetical protein